MRLAQPVAGLVAVSLIGLAPLTLAAPAGAADPIASKSELKVSSYSNVVRYGDGAYLYADVTDTTTGYGVYDVGTMRIQQSVAGGAWTNTTLTAPGGYKSFQVKPKANTRYRIAFSGGTNSRGVTYAASTSPAVTYKVQRVLKLSNKGRKVTAKLTPKVKGKKIVFKISKKRNGKYKTFKAVRTNKAGKATITAPRGTRYWKIKAGADKKFVSSVWEGSSYTY